MPLIQEKDRVGKPRPYEYDYPIQIIRHNIVSTLS